MALSRIHECVAQIYGSEAAPGIARGIERVVQDHRTRLPAVAPRQLNERDTFLITYADQIREAGESPLRTLGNFAEANLQEVVNGIHLLPFYPSSSDDGFSVMDYRTVAAEYGTWEDIHRVGGTFSLMFDAVLNHASAKSEWFRAYLRNDPRFREYFISVVNEPDLSAVVRPRTSPLLTTFSMAQGGRKVWTTFGPDQVDLNYHDPKVLQEILDVLLFYVEQGASFIRLDAIAYLWKEIGTTCIHLPQVHSIVRLMRAVLDEAAPHVRLITETNVSHAENASYLGDGGDEAHLIYNFSLPPLVLHAFQSKQAVTLADWAGSLKLPSDQTAFFNVLATHDGIGLNGARGILSEEQIEQLVKGLEQGGTPVSRKSDPGGGSSPYEINANYYDALSAATGTDASELGIARFLAAHAIMLAFRGMPGIYFHSLFGSRGWHQGALQTGRARTVNREKLPSGIISGELARPSSFRSRIYNGMKHLLSARRGSATFAPRAEQTIIHSHSGVFAFVRIDDSSGDQVVCIHNITPETQTFPCAAWKSRATAKCEARDLIGGKAVAWDPLTVLVLRPYQAMWLRMRDREE